MSGKFDGCCRILKMRNIRRRAQVLQVRVVVVQEIMEREE
jgi:hypothetical protein